MRIRLTIATAALLLASAHFAAAQSKPADPAPTLFGLTGTIDFGFRSESPRATRPGWNAIGICGRGRPRRSRSARTPIGRCSRCVRRTSGTAISATP